MGRNGEDEYHVYVTHGDERFYLAEDGTFVAELGKALAMSSLDEAFDAVNRTAEGRDLGKDEPGVAKNARRWSEG